MLSPLIQFPSSGLFKPAFPSSTPESLTPLHNAAAPVASTSQLPQPAQPSPVKTNGFLSAKGKERERPEDLVVPPHLAEMANVFSQRSLLVRESFEWWLEKTKDRLLEEAYKRSEEYKERLQRERLDASTSSYSRGSTPPKRRRMSMDGVAESIQAKRKKRRVSAEPVAPLDDEALAQQFKEVRQATCPC